MRSWPTPKVPQVDGHPEVLHLYDSADQQIKAVEIPAVGPVGMYVCGITPYDSTHLGHAATYLTFDLVYRQLLDQGHEVRYVQNITDVDDPLFERAERDQVDWRELGESQIERFRNDMKNLAVIPPQHYIGATESIDEAASMVKELLDTGAAYVIDDPVHPDIYADIEATAAFGYESNYSAETMAEIFPERGGDPERPGKRHRLDALLWRSPRESEPAWDSVVGPGRPGWHVECAAIAANRLGAHFAIQGGGEDLKFPHHEFSAAHVEAARGVERMAGHYVHTGMIGLDGTKMSKSLGNLVFVSELVAAGHEPAAIRVGVFAGHYRRARDWSESLLVAAEERLRNWRSALTRGTAGHDTATLITTLRSALADDLDTPTALAALDEWSAGDSVTLEESDRKTIVAAVDALLGIKL